MHYNFSKLLELIPRLDNAVSHIIARRYEEFVASAKRHLSDLSVYVSWTESLHSSRTRIRKLDNSKWPVENMEAWITPQLEVYGELQHCSGLNEVPNHVIYFRAYIHAYIHAEDRGLASFLIWSKGVNHHPEYPSKVYFSVDPRIIDEDLKVDRRNWIKLCGEMVRYLKERPIFNSQ